MNYDDLSVASLKVNPLNERPNDKYEVFGEDCKVYLTNNKKVMNLYKVTIMLTQGYMGLKTAYVLAESPQGAASQATVGREKEGLRREDFDFQVEQLPLLLRGWSDHEF